MSSLCMHARRQSLSPLADSRVNDSLLHPTLQRGTASSRRCSYLHGSYTHAASWLLRSCRRRGSDLYCLAARDQDQWSRVSPAAAAGWCSVRDVPERCLVKRVAWGTFDCWKHLLRQHDIAVIGLLAVHLHPGVDKYQFSHCSINIICNMRQNVPFPAFYISKK